LFTHEAHRSECDWAIHQYSTPFPDGLRGAIIILEDPVEHGVLLTSFSILLLLLFLLLLFLLLPPPPPPPSSPPPPPPPLFFLLVLPGFELRVSWFYGRHCTA
jgi:drug/metabolite transporter (DMT)-like permease